jgi:hypothetical protein
VTDSVLPTLRQQVRYLVPRYVLSRPAQTASAESEERPFITQSNVPSTHLRAPLCNIAYTLSRRLTQASDIGLKTSARRRKAGQVLAARADRQGAGPAQSQGDRFGPTTP